MMFFIMNACLKHVLCLLWLIEFLMTRLVLACLVMICLVLAMGIYLYEYRYMLCLLAWFLVR